MDNNHVRTSYTIYHIVDKLTVPKRLESMSILVKFIYIYIYIYIYIFVCVCVCVCVHECVCVLILNYRGIIPD